MKRRRTSRNCSVSLSSTESDPPPLSRHGLINTVLKRIRDEKANTIMTVNKSWIEKKKVDVQKKQSSKTEGRR